MSNTLTAFLRPNVEQVPNVKITASPRFKGEDGAAKCTVFPDLNNAELQDSWGVTKPEELLGAMLIGGEFDDYVTEVFRINGFKAEQDLVDEAKN